MAIAVSCNQCNKTYQAPDAKAGQRCKCPGCGTLLEVPRISISEPVLKAAQNASAAQGAGSGTLIALWGVAGMVVIAVILFLVWHSNSSHQAKIEAANNRIESNITTANEWLASGSVTHGAKVDKALVDALGDEYATKKESGILVLNEVRQRLEDLKEQARTKSAQSKAAALLNDALRRIDEKRVPEGIRLLHEFIADKNATGLTNAQKLLAEAELAISDDYAIKAMIEMSEDEFSKLKNLGEISDGKITHPILVGVRKDTIQRNLGEANRQREETKRIELVARIENERQKANRINPPVTKNLILISKDDAGTYIKTAVFVEIIGTSVSPESAGMLIRQDNRNIYPSRSATADDLISNTIPQQSSYYVSAGGRPNQNEFVTYGNSVVVGYDVAKWWSSAVYAVCEKHAKEKINEELSNGDNFRADIHARMIQRRAIETSGSLGVGNPVFKATAYIRPYVDSITISNNTSGLFTRTLNVDPKTGDVTVKSRPFNEGVSKVSAVLLEMYGIVLHGYTINDSYYELPEERKFLTN